MFLKRLIDFNRMRAWLIVGFLLVSCGRVHEETIAGVDVPVPPGMLKAQNREAALSVPGFSGGQASFHGNMKPGEVINFYRKEMATRGWHSGVGLVSDGGIVSFTKERQTLVITVVESDKGSTVTVVVGTAR